MTKTRFSGPFIIAIDGGGSSCKASLFDVSSEKVVANAITGPANVYSNFDLAMENIAIASTKLLEQLNCKSKRIVNINECFLSAGLAGAKTKLAQGKLVNWQHPFKDIYVTTDLHIGCAGSNSLNDCFFIIVGTGSCFALYKDRSLTQYGGYGFLLGDQASGAWLGKKALTWYLKSLDLNLNKCALGNLLNNFIGEDTTEILDNYSVSHISNIAKLAPEIMKLRSNSKQVDKWLDEGAEYIFSLLMAHASSVDTICIAGGLASVYKEKLKENYNLTLQEPKKSPLYGAYLLAKDKFFEETK